MPLYFTLASEVCFSLFESEHCLQCGWWCFEQNSPNFVRVDDLLFTQNVEERREELAEQFSELQKRLKAQALEHNIIRLELQQARSELEAAIVNSK